MLALTLLIPFMSLASAVGEADATARDGGAAPTAQVAFQPAPAGAPESASGHPEVTEASRDRETGTGFMSFLRREMSALWDAAMKAGSLAFGVVIFFFAIALFRVPFSWISRLMLRMRGDSELRVYDLMDGATPGVSDVQAERLKMIFRQVALKHQGPPIGYEADLGDALPHWDPPAYVDLSSFSKLVSDDLKVTIGPVALSARTLWSGLMRLFPKPRYLIEGVVIPENGNTRVTFERFDNARRKKAGSWTASAMGTTVPSINEAFQQLALKMAHGQLKEAQQLTQSPDAFAAYHQAALILNGVTPSASRAEALEKGRGLLQTALAMDPNMSQAKLQLANVTSDLGEPEVARALLREVPKGPLSERVDFHLARLDARIWRLKDLQSARETFERLARGKGALALEAKGLLLEVCARLKTGNVTKTQLSPEEHAELDRRIQELEPLFEADQPPADVSTREFTAVRSYALYTMGKRRLRQASSLEEVLKQERNKLRREGLAYIQRALVYMPESVSAYVVVAREYRAARWPQWVEFAERALAHAARVKPDDPMVNEEYGHLYLERQPPQYEKAAGYFERAADARYKARFEWGRLLASKLGEPAKGIERMWEAIRMRMDMGTVSSSYLEALVDVALQAAKELRERPLSGGGTATGEHAVATPMRDPAREMVEQADAALAWLTENHRQLLADKFAAELTKTANPGLDRLIAEYARSIEAVSARISVLPEGA